MCGIRRDERNWQNREASNTDDICGDIVHSLASSGGKAAYPPYGGFQSHPLRGWILYFQLQTSSEKGDGGWELKIKIKN